MRTEEEQGVKKEPKASGFLNRVGMGHNTVSCRISPLLLSGAIHLQGTVCFSLFTVGLSALGPVCGHERSPSQLLNTQTDTVSVKPINSQAEDGCQGQQLLAGSGLGW